VACKKGETYLNFISQIGGFGASHDFPERCILIYLLPTFCYKIYPPSLVFLAINKHVKVVIILNGQVSLSTPNPHFHRISNSNVKVEW
jgi:hypothetical protein